MSLLAPSRNSESFGRLSMSRPRKHKKEIANYLGFPLRILYLEDEPKDAELVQGSLEAEGIVCDLTRADTQAGFLTLLQQGGFDLILADYTLPLFDGISALRIA